MLANKTPTRIIFPSQVRLFEPRHDLLGVANLIELCFSDTLNQDGRKYIQEMRQTAQSHSHFVSVWSNTRENAIPSLGFVWEENRQIIGNLTIIPHHSKTGTHYLIANVAVHPDYRRRGIAQLLTERAILYLHQKGEKEVWLQVRDDNQGAINLYKKLGFVEKMRRTIWEIPNGKLPSVSSNQENQNFTFTLTNYSIRRRKPSEWHIHENWLNDTYPPQFGWHVNFDLDSFQPGLKGWFYSSWYEMELIHWSLYFQERLIGIASVESSPSASKNIYLATEKLFEDQAIFALVRFILDQYSRYHNWLIDYPAYRANKSLQACGLIPTQSLIWMMRQT